MYSFLVLISFHFLFLILLSIGSNDVRQRISGNDNSANKEEEEGTKQIQFDIEEIKQIKTDFHKESGFQKAVQFSRDHSILATGGSDGYLRVWKVTSSWIFSTPRGSWVELTGMLYFRHLDLVEVFEQVLLLLLVLFLPNLH